jgi:hypothetical protein
VILELGTTPVVPQIRKWLRGVDLNHRPLGYEPNELPDCSTPHFDHSNRAGLRQTLQPSVVVQFACYLEQALFAPRRGCPELAEGIGQVRQIRFPQLAWSALDEERARGKNAGILSRMPASKIHCLSLIGLVFLRGRGLGSTQYRRRSQHGEEKRLQFTSNHN